ncbi:MAG: squalene-hopene cyclase [Phycisphaerales bacterium]|nr:squalene-hopene cyclase [Phycisphaerales bacterium]MDB5353979.1 squalene-hopene cyclase [Phycisphaerales bacterium]
MPTQTLEHSPRHSKAPVRISLDGGLNGHGRSLDRALGRARDALIAKQNEQGYWVGELQGDSILESEYLLLMFILGLEADPALPKIANYLRRLQNADGGWGLFPGGPADISGTVKAYFALKLMGDDPSAPHMALARKLILSLGGAEKCNTFTKFYFACLGQISFDSCPAIPPEVVFLPKWFYFNLYHVSAWTRTMILPLGIVTCLRGVRHLPPEKGIGELYIDRVAADRLAEPVKGLPRNWGEVFLKIDDVLKLYNQAPIAWLREKALKAAEQWMLERLEGCDGLGAIFPPMVYILIVFRLLGYSDEHPVVQKAHKDLRDLFLDGPGPDEIRIQPCHSPVWDTGIALHALAETGLAPETESARRATQWLLEKECKIASDWRKNCPNAEIGGWFFEFNNPHYPDVDDTAMVTVALKRAGGEIAKPAVQRGLQWLLCMQNEDGGWAAFDRTKDRPILEKIPFADHNAMQDPSCPDITGRVLECLGHNGFTADHPAVKHAIAYIHSQQDIDGGWWGRWGVNFVYGTWQVLTGLKAVKADMTQTWVRRAAQWLLKVQKEDGSFGETAQSYEDLSLKGKGESTPSQTAWGAMGLIAALGADDPAVARAIQWLIDNQAADGAWDEHFYTGTGFPKVFYLKYHLYRHYFPLTALARYKRLKGM